MTANCKLNNLEYLALKMLSTPGQSGRFYLKALHKYRFPLADKPKGNFCPEYFAPSGKYFDVLWVDEAECTIPFQSNIARRNRPEHVATGYGTQSGFYLKPTSSQWHLTEKGYVRAQTAALKLGLSLESLMGL